MATNTTHAWDRQFASRSPVFEPLQHIAERFSRFVHRWPQLEDYQAVLDHWPQPILSAIGKPINVVPQDAKPRCFASHYVPRIHFSGELQTRAEHWHDFFQLLTWLMFPKTKALIYQLAVPDARRRLEDPAAERRGHRSPLENMLALFDEGGAVVVASDRSLLQLVESFQWKTLFWQRRSELNDRLQCVSFGHALYEKALAPYVGMTAHAVLLTVENGYFSMPWQQRLAYLDNRLVSLLADRERYSRPADLAPFPVLGMPGWDMTNECEDYYNNASYFRRGRRERRQHG